MNPPCKNESKRIGIEAITKKCLCRKHNSALSVLDSAASHAFDALRQQKKISNEILKEPERNFKRTTFSINATALERWLLKSLINFTYGSDYFIGHESNEKGRPSKYLVEAAFGICPFREGNGMYLAARQGATFYSTDVVSFSPLINEEKCVIAGQFVFRGLLLFMNISPNRLPTSFEQLPGVREEWKNVDLHKRMRKIEVRHDNRVVNTFRLNWQ